MRTKSMLTPIRLLVVVFLTALSCSTNDGTQDAFGPDSTGTQDNIVDPTDVVGDLGPEAKTPRVVIEIQPQELGEDAGAYCACSASTDWCGITAEELRIRVFVSIENMPDDGSKGATKASIEYVDEEGNTTELGSDMTLSLQDGKEYFELRVDADDIETESGYPDGTYEMTIRVETDLTFTMGNLELPVKGTEKVTVVVDTTAPGFSPVTLKTPVQDGVYASTLDVQYCVKDFHPKDNTEKGSGVAPDTISFALLKGPETLELEPTEQKSLTCPLSSPIKLDVAQNNTDTYDFRIQAMDCAGNVGERIVPSITVVGLPNYVSLLSEPMPLEPPPPGEEAMVDPLGPVKFSRAAHIVTDPDPESGKGEDLAPDLALFAEKGVAFSYNDGAGHLSAPELVLPGVTANDGWVMDVDGDKATDIVALVDDGEHSFLKVYLQHVAWNNTNSPWLAKGTFPNYDAPSESYDLGKATYLVSDRFDINNDGFADLVLGGPSDTASLLMVLHTGVIEDSIGFPPEGYKPPEAPKDQENNPLPFTESPKQPDHFIIHDKFQGQGGISDVYVGQFRADNTGNMGPVEIAVVRPALGLITVVTLDSLYHFSSGLDTDYCWGGASKIAKPSDLRRGHTIGGETDHSDIWASPLQNDLEDLVVFSTTTMALHFVPNPKNGYFDQHQQQYKLGGVCMDGYGTDWGMEYILEEGFGQLFVTNTAARRLGTQPADHTTEGNVLYLDKEPDTIWLADVTVPGLAPEQKKDGVLDLVVPVPDRNFIALYPGMSFYGSDDGKFEVGLRLNPGPRPRACAMADFNLDQSQDIACVVTLTENSSNPGGEGLVVVTTGAKGDYVDTLPVELPLPQKVDWMAGIVAPTHMAVADIENDADNDILVATATEPQLYWMPKGLDGTWNGQWYHEQMESANVPLILTYRLESGSPDTLVPDQSSVDLSFQSDLTGLSVGNFNDDIHPDVAVSIEQSADTTCAGRTVDVLLGNNAISGLNTPEFVGLDAAHMTFYQSIPLTKGRFLPMGGYIALQNATGLIAAKLNSGDNLDDLLVFGVEYLTPEDELYQPHQLGTYITEFGVGWNVSPNSCGAMARPYFDGAPPFPTQGPELPVCGADPPELPAEGEVEAQLFECLPVYESLAWYEMNWLSPGQAYSGGNLTAQWEAGEGPFAGVKGDFYAPANDNGCPDFFVANKQTEDATYVRGQCSPLSYKFDGQTHLFPIGAAPVDIAAADLNQDGYYDMIAALGADISVMYGAEGELFDAPFYLEKGEGFEDLAPTAIASDDVNDDGWADLLVTSSNHMSVLVYLNGGVSQAEMANPEPHRTRFLGPFTLPAGVTPTEILVAPIYTDLQIDPADNCNDVAVLNAESGTVTLLKNRRCKK